MNSFTLNSVLRITLRTDIRLHSLLRKILNLRPGSDGRPKLLRPAELIQTHILIPAELIQKEKNIPFDRTSCKYVITIYALGLHSF